MQAATASDTFRSQSALGVYIGLLLMLLHIRSLVKSGAGSGMRALQRKAEGSKHS